MLAIQMRSEGLQMKKQTEKAKEERDAALATVAAAEKSVEGAQQSEAKALAELAATKDRLARLQSELDSLSSAKTLECRDLNAALAKVRGSPETTNGRVRAVVGIPGRILKALPRPSRQQHCRYSPFAMLLSDPQLSGGMTNTDRSSHWHAWTVWRRKAC